MLPRQPNQSVIDGFRCLQFVVAQEQPVGVTFLSEELGMEITRVHRLLRTLSHLGLIKQTDGKKYGPGPAIPVLAAQTLHATHFGDKVLPELQRLGRSTKQNVALGVLWERSVSYLYHGKGSKGIGGHELWPASKSGLGLLILSRKTDEQVRALMSGHPIPGFENVKALCEALAKIRRQGYVFVHTIKTEATLAVALEVNDSLALGVTGRFDSSSVPHLLPLLTASAAEIDGSFSLFRS